MSTVDSLCLLSARNLGDAVIHARLLRALVQAGHARRYIVWTFPQAACLFEGLGCTLIVSTFPTGSSLRTFLRHGPGSCLSALRRVRALRPTQVLELVGDARERWLCRLIGAKETVGLGWPKAHPFRRHIHGATRHAAVVVPRDTTNLYDALGLVFRRLTGSATDPFAAPLEARRAHDVRRIGVHPCASVPSKQWPPASWVELLRSLHSRDPEIEIVLFGSPEDRGALERLAGETGRPVEVRTGALEAFARDLAQVDCLVGLDSFAVHLASGLGIPAVVLVGPNDPRLFTPPGAAAVSRASACPDQPCSGRVRCRGTAHQYACMKAISAADVMARIPGPAGRS